MNRPWMPLYVADYLRDTSHLCAAESGAYLHLIMAYWVSGKLPDNDRQLATIAKLDIRQWKQIKPTIQAFFHDGWKHKRIDQELAHAAEVSCKRKAAAQQRHSKNDANAHAIADANGDTLHTSHITKKKEEEKPADAGHAFVGSIVRLSRKHWDDWTAAYPNLDLRAELTARDAWLGSPSATDRDRKNWFLSTATHLRNLNQRAKQELASGKTTGNVIAAADKLVERIREFNKPPPALRSGEGAPPARLISKG